MWYLTSDNDKRVIYIVPPVEIVVGRSVDVQVCNFSISDDPSISRKHATLTVSNNMLILQDLASRYGTFVNDEKVESDCNVTLKDNDVLKFGKMNSIWRVHAVSLVTCSSTLKGENLQNLRMIISKIGGIFKGDWDETCSYLTMPAITLTIKVVLALVQGSHIVTTEYWNQCLDAVNNLTALPDPKNFTPEVVESTLNKEVVSFLPDTRRKTLFADKKFIFFSRRQFEMYRTVLMASSATPMLLSESRMTASMLCEQNVIVIQYASYQETQIQRNQINDIINYLKNKGKRVVADAEIGLAILYCSTDKYCNPNFSFTSEVVKQIPEENKVSNVLAQESQEIGPHGGFKKENVVINESLVTEDKKNIFDDVGNNTKRKLSEFTSDFQANPNKKIATSSHIANIPNESSKRKLSEDDTSMPSKKVAVDENQDTGDIFNFVNSNADSSDHQNKAKKLNLSKPQKRKLDAGGNDSLFNFIETNDGVKSSEDLSKQSIFTIDKNRQDESANAIVKTENTDTITAEDVAAMRGVKLKELRENNLLYNLNIDHKIKKENSDDLEEKMSGLDLGCTIVITCDDLIVKKEPVYKIEGENTSVKNFKTFKKVWPLKKQATVISAASMSIAT